MSQLPLAFSHYPRLRAEDFLVSAANREAFAWVARWPQWGSYGLVLYGPKACGKSHLARIWQEKSAAVWHTMTSLPATPSGEHSIVLDSVESPLDEIILLGWMNTLKESGKSLLITASNPPARWGIKLPDLSSRLAALPAVEMQAPDDALLSALFLKLFSDRQLKVEEGVVVFLLPRVERSFAAVAALVEKLDSASMREKRAITIPLAKAVLEEK